METLKRLYYTHLNKKKSKDFTPHVKKSRRSFWGNVILGLFLLAMAVAFFFPVVYMVSQSMKPMNEMFVFPPKILVSNPTMDNYRDFVNVLANTVVPVTRSLFNSLFVVVIGSVGHILLASLCAYPSTFSFAPVLSVARISSLTERSSRFSTNTWVRTSSTLRSGFSRTIRNTSSCRV